MSSPLRVGDLLAVAATLAGLGSSAACVLALGDRRDLAALCWLIIAALLLKAASESLRSVRVT